MLFDARCCFCIKARLGVPAREDFIHLFFACPVIQQCINTYVFKFSDGLADVNDIRRFLFTGTCLRTTSKDTRVVLLSNMIFFFSIWQCKLGRRLPSYTTLENNLFLLLDNSLSLSTNLLNLALTSSSPVCRLENKDWARLRVGLFLWSRLAVLVLEVVLVVLLV